MSAGGNLAIVLVVLLAAGGVAGAAAVADMAPTGVLAQTDAENTSTDGTGTATTDSGSSTTTTTDASGDATTDAGEPTTTSTSDSPGDATTDADDSTASDGSSDSNQAPSGGGDQTTTTDGGVAQAAGGSGGGGAQTTTTTDGGDVQSTSATDDGGVETTNTSDGGSAPAECLPNPYDVSEEDTYTRDEYEMGMPDRFVEDVLATDGVEAFYYGYEGQQAGLAWLVTGESGAEPMVYCKANSPDNEGIVLSDWRFGGTYTDAYGDTDFTPAAARWTVDPTYERDMTISDQSVDWLLEQDHVQRVERTRTCDRSGCGEGVTVYLETHPLDQDDWWKQLPDRIDGVDVNYAEA